MEPSEQIEPLTDTEAEAGHILLVQRSLEAVGGDSPGDSALLGRQLRETKTFWAHKKTAKSVYEQSRQTKDRSQER